MLENVAHSTTSHLSTEMGWQHSHELVHVARVDLALAIEFQILHATHHLLEGEELGEKLLDVTNGSSRATRNAFDARILAWLLGEVLGVIELFEGRQSFRSAPQKRRPRETKKGRRSTFGVHAVHDCEVGLEFVVGIDARGKVLKKVAHSGEHLDDLVDGTEFEDALKLLVHVAQGVRSLLDLLAPLFLLVLSGEDRLDLLGKLTGGSKTQKLGNEIRGMEGLEIVHVFSRSDKGDGTLCGCDAVSCNPISLVPLFESDLI